MTASYTFGTVTVTNGSDMVTGDLTGWQTANVAPGFFGIDTEDGRSVPVAEIIDDNTLRLVIPWRGANAAGVGYYLSYDTRDGQQTVNNSQRLAEYLARLNRNSLLAVASLDPEADTYIKFTGSGTAVLVNASEIEGGGAGGEGGVAVDAYVPDLAARAEYDGRSRGFIVMVGDAGDGRAAIYYKLSTASGDWSDPAYVTGPVGSQGVQGIQGEPGLDGSDGADGTIYTSRGDYSAATEYVVNDTVLFYGSTYVAIQDSVGQSPPMAYGESNAFWQLVAQRGVDGMGTGDVVGPSSSADNRIALFDGITGKLLKDSGLTTNDLVPADGSITNDKLANMPTSRLRGRVTAGDGVVENLTAAQALAILASGGNYDRSTILGTVAKSGTIPSGALIEFGSVGLARYVRFADGTQMCWKPDCNFEYQSAANLVFTWTFPAVFIESPICGIASFSTSGSDYSGSFFPRSPVLLGNAAVAAATLYLRGQTSWDTGQYARNQNIYAIGRWSN